jgi:hypothetical protein
VLESYNDDHAKGLIMRGIKNNKVQVVGKDLNQNQILEKLNVLNVMK